MTLPSMQAGVDVYDVQWEGVMDNGLTYFQENAGQSHARKLPRPLSEIRVLCRQWQGPFSIPIPDGALPVIHQIGCIAVRMSNDPNEKPRHLPPEYVFGWEKEVDGEMIYSLWQFGDHPPIHKDRP